MTKIYKTFIKFRRKSYFLRLINLNLPIIITDKHIYLTYRIILEAKTQYESQFEGNFYVLIYPMSDYFSNYKKNKDALLKYLNDGEIDYIEINMTAQKYWDSYQIREDRHPNSKMNELIAKHINKELLQ